MAKTLRELLNKYIPDDNEAAILNSGVVSRSLVDKEKRCLEVYADFDAVISKKQLYALEEKVKAAYELQLCRIKPRYPSEAFSFEYLKDILLETERTGVVARGFFGSYDYSVEGNIITVKIPFSEYGIDLLDTARTPAVIENIIKDEFGLSYRVIIRQNGDDILQMSDEYRSRLENKRDTRLILRRQIIFRQYRMNRRKSCLVLLRYTERGILRGSMTAPCVSAV